MARPTKPDALELAKGQTRLEQAVLRSRQLLRKRAIVAGVAGAVPLPGLDWAVDAAMLTQLLPKINEEFGLAPHQIAKLDAREKERMQKAITMIGSVIAGRLVTKALVLRFARLVGVRLTAAQAARYVPLAFDDSNLLPEPGKKPGASAPNRFYMYGVVARLAMLAASYELEATDPLLEELS